MVSWAHRSPYNTPNGTLAVSVGLMVVTNRPCYMCKNRPHLVRCQSRHRKTLSDRVNFISQFCELNKSAKLKGPDIDAMPTVIGIGVENLQLAHY